MRKDYASKLTKDMLIKSGITEITEDGFVFKGTTPAKFVFEKTKSQYKYLTIYDFDEEGNKIKLYNHPNDPRVYRYKQTTVSLQRAIYAWFHEEVPAGYVIDHIDNDPFNNNIDNLQLLTPAENLEKSRAARKLKAVYIPPIGYKKIYTKEYVDGKIAEFTKLYEDAKQSHNAYAAHSYRASISQWRRRKEILFGEDED